MSIVRRSYDDHYFDNALHKTTPNSQRNRMRLNLARLFNRQGRLLEIGPGTGEFLELASQHYDVEGIEISPHALNHVTPGLRKSIKLGNIEDTPLPAARYDVIAAFNVLEHLERPSPVLEKVNQSLTPRGCLIGSVPCNAGPVGQSATKVVNFFDRTHRSTFEPERWQALFRQAGFSSIRLFGEIPVGPRFSFFVQKPVWRYISPNLMFACRSGHQQMGPA